MTIHEAVMFYKSHGMRPMPIFDVSMGCKHRPYKPELDCKGQCWGKVPIIEHWTEKDDFEIEDFPEKCNLALIMGKQLDGRWLVGIDIDGELDLSEFIHVPETLECKTNRGKHLIYEVTPDSPLGNWNDIFNTRSDITGYKCGYNGAVDLKYCRGAMVSPPSKTKTDLVYEWIEWRQPAFMADTEVKYLIRKRKISHAKVKRYTRWTLDPSHKGKRP